MCPLHGEELAKEEMHHGFRPQTDPEWSKAECYPPVKEKV